MTTAKLRSVIVKTFVVISAALFVAVGWFHSDASTTVADPQYTANITATSRRSNALVYHAASNKIYASIPSMTSSKGNSIARIDPESGAVEQSVWVGSEPEKLVIAPDGTTLYVKLKGARGIRKVDLNTFTAGPQFQGGLTFYDGPLKIVDFAVSTTDPNLVAVSRNSESSSGSRGVAVFDNGVQRPTTGSESEALAFSTSDSLLYGHSYVGGLLLRLSLNANGVGSVTSTPGAGGSQLKLVNGRLYTSYGRVIDPASGNLIGTFTFPEQFDRPFFVDQPNNKIYFARQEYNGLEIRCFDTETFVPIGTLLFQGVAGTPKDIVRWGTNGLAVSTPNASTYFIKSDLVGPGSTGSPAPSPTPEPVPYSSAFVRRVDIKNDYILFNELDQKVYASVPSSAGPGLGNTITRVDPVTGQTVSSVFIGSEPGILSLSDDGATLYAALNGAQSIRRFDTVTQTAGIQFVAAAPGYRTTDIVVLPGSPQTVVAYSGGTGIGVYDNGVRRPVSPNVETAVIESDGTPNVIYGYNPSSTGYKFHKLGVTPNGLTDLASVQNLIYLTHDVKFSAGRLFVSDGRVVDPENQRILGMFNVTHGYAVAVDPSLGRAFILTREEIAAYDINTYNKIGAIPNPAADSIAYYEPGALTRWGPNGLAFRNRTQSNNPTDQIYLIQTSLVSSSGTVPTGYYLDSSTITVGEYWANIPVNIRRTGDLFVPTTVNYATANGTATAGTDYVATSGTAVFGPGEASKTINIPLIQDSLYEGNETLTFTLSNPTGTSPEIMTHGATTITLIDDESEPRIYGYADPVTEPPVGQSRTSYVSVSLSNESQQTVTVDFTTANGSAHSGSDYIATNGTLTFSPMETTKLVQVQILGDPVPEAEEYFNVILSNPTNSTVPFPQVSVSIRNLNNTARVFDFDGDAKTDVAIFRPPVAEWWIQRSLGGSVFATPFGAPGDRIVPSDYSGDGKCDIAVWRPTSGEWFVMRSEDFTYFSFPFGSSGDVPAPADFDADGKADTAVFRPGGGTWYIRYATGGVSIQQFGLDGDVPVASDYDADGRADVAIFRPSNGQWWLNRSTAGVFATTFGDSNDKPVPGDYTGDGMSDIAFWRPSTGEWFILRSSDSSYYSRPFGTNGDLPAPGDYDGDGKLDLTVFRPSSGTWYIQRTTGGTVIQQFGSNGDRPLANAFVP